MLSAVCLQRLVNLKEHSGFFGKSCPEGNFRILLFVFMSAFCLQKFIYISVWRQSGCTVKAKVVNFWWASMMNFWSSCFQCVLYILERIGKRTRSWIWSCPRFKSINRVFVSLDLAVSFILYFSCFDLWIFFLTFLYDKIRDLKIIALTSTQTNF